MANISLKNIYKDFYGLGCLTGITFEVLNNEIVVLTGPESSGKSVILRIIAGIEKATSGEIYFDGKLFNDVRLKDRNAGLVFTKTALFKRKTLYDNIAYGLKIRKFDKNEIDLKVIKAAEILGIKDELDKKLKFLDNDTKQLAAVARAVIRKPSVLLMDEPFSNENNSLLIEKFLKLKEVFNATCIYATKNLSDAKFLNKKTIVLKDYGVIRQIADFEDLKKEDEDEQ